MSSSNGELELYRALPNAGEVIRAVVENRDPEHVDATGLEELDDLVNVLTAAVVTVRQRRDESQEFAARVILPDVVSVEVSIASTEEPKNVSERSALEASRRSLILDILDRAGGLPLTKEVFNYMGYNDLAPDVSKDANNKAFRKIMSSLTKQGIVEEVAPGFFSIVPEARVREVSKSGEDLGEDSSFLV